MLGEILRHNKKYFNTKQLIAEFEISDNAIDLKGEIVPKVGQYVLIQSDLNFAVCKVLSSTDTTFVLEGTLVDDTTKSICLLSVPPSLVSLAVDIASFNDANKGSALVSESFGGWSGTKATGKNGMLTWQEKYADSLKPYRGVFLDVEVTR